MLVPFPAALASSLEERAFARWIDATLPNLPPLETPTVTSLADVGRGEIKGQEPTARCVCAAPEGLAPARPWSLSLSWRTGWG